MQVFHVLNDMIDHKLAVVIRGNSTEQALKTADACYLGGIRVLEVTFTVNGADEVMKTLIEQYDDAIVGAGTVLDAETARIAIVAGARFIVSPAFDRETALLCNRYQIPYLPGCMTITEMVTALEYGAQVVKLFPGQSYAPSFISNVKGPLPHLNIMPTGGITLDNVSEWLQAGAVMTGVGGEITKGAKTGDYAAVTEEAERFVSAVGGRSS
ncbi:bifunctional 2-keto-4-hydroxyglutarate aldolase/2-keto-3-deoxy-6-phosphogluconate aldolase [Salipaludibacillus agaradhaerens]|jgi:2-dehydro-3-deoxyphosphogluconate aldolase/(4S)-4-hydroxy-2-oxoglutarate aldolase|uniref:Bifunctional 2-keto-4-hydroxyglutarate aldolase/2-keto-3-deoxy-6-phosphogluconate aldolase n=1 Tax=Salipaludibacillus agaradhaerens TaxID=76935 RepID=A0A9Q4B4N2_SALAG|nr:bifunctional 2-keto-4-hydroxyglutarate aldolase/2-keto-3-deoxy-6-phosphogluconate aldolase [Salipaludibacillus agaradhaerens]MCR6098257.1 bifunctional 2-keto-4-hydroxyglutarate aldolase/2-keto-3-deoxy-6-phosphogluconate aldolase [Salipaludibacillus agaradhaerens]MCR6104888.1 bifunctional 2-keto-4-hydroxyglutarate aldolase/2-keto-3-deoxy-6-phosphogluconate aldolase [Salipaludibacillus agaradhaerens]MCR6116113.1 bifunctional 2-keto-4-hydroxyglutarate aldolase/2-keto-3-deoxy-6-phosphogluconate a